MNGVVQALPAFEVCGFEMRRAVRSDVSGIVALLYDDALGRQREIVSDPPAPTYTAAFDAISADPNQLLAVLVDCEDGAILGCLQLTFIPGLSHQGLWRGQIEGVRVASNHRGRGLGSAMIAWATAACKDRGCGLVQLTSSISRTEARRFYENLGFEATHTGFKRDLR